LKFSDKYNKEIEAEIDKIMGSRPVADKNWRDNSDLKNTRDF
jgi:hypothetical protein